MKEAEPLEDFDTLLQRLPRTDAAAWRAAATRQLRGASLDSIDIDLAGGLQVEPYATMAGDTSGGTRFGRYGWSIVADLHKVDALGLADVLTELEGGATGLWLPGGVGEARAPTEFADVRFDYLLTIIGGARAEDALATAKLVVPEAQRTEAELWLSCPQPAEASARLSAAKQEFAKAHMLLHVPASATAGDATAQLVAQMAVLRDAIGPAKDADVVASGLALRVQLGADYLHTLVGLRALRLGFANLCDAFGLSQPFPVLKLLGTIVRAAPGQSAEAYLIDATVRATAAATAGVDAISIAPHPEGDVAVQRRRVRNLQHALYLEGGLPLAGDALHGAAWVSQAAAKLGAAAWKQLST